MGQMCVHMRVGPTELVSTEVADHNMCLSVIWSLVNKNYFSSPTEDCYLLS